MSKMMFNFSPNREGTGIVACSKSKLCVPAPAFMLYGISSLSKLQMLHCLATCSNSRIVSAKHGLLDFFEWVAPYNFSVYEMSEDEKHDWGLEIALRLRIAFPDESFKFSPAFKFYTGKEYFEPISRYISQPCEHMDGDMFHKTKTYAKDLKGWGWSTQSYWPKLPTEATLLEIWNAGPSGLPLIELGQGQRALAIKCRALHQTSGDRITSLGWFNKVRGLDEWTS